MVTSWPRKGPPESNQVYFVEYVCDDGSGAFTYAVKHERGNADEGQQKECQSCVINKKKKDLQQWPIVEVKQNQVPAKACKPSQVPAEPRRRRWLMVTSWPRKRPPESRPVLSFWGPWHTHVSCALEAHGTRHSGSSHLRRCQQSQEAEGGGWWHHGQGRGHPKAVQCCLLGKLLSSSSMCVCHPGITLHENKKVPDDEMYPERWRKKDHQRWPKAQPFMIGRILEINHLGDDILLRLQCHYR